MFVERRDIFNDWKSEVEQALTVVPDINKSCNDILWDFWDGVMVLDFRTSGGVLNMFSILSVAALSDKLKI